MSISRQGSTSNNLLITGLGIGLFIGVVIGLIIGWGIWPVTWQNAWPDDLNVESKAHYLAAVADAYVSSGEANAATLAQERLRGFGDDLAQEFQTAADFLAQDPQSEAIIRIGNLQRLAAALEIDSGLVDGGSDTVNTPASGSAQQPITPDADAAPAAAVESSQSTTRIVRLFMTFLTALLLLLGAGYLFYYIYLRPSAARSQPQLRTNHQSKHSDTTGDDFDEFTDQFDDYVDQYDDFRGDSGRNLYDDFDDQFPNGSEDEGDETREDALDHRRPDELGTYETNPGRGFDTDAAAGSYRFDEEPRRARSQDLAQTGEQRVRSGPPLENRQDDSFFDADDLMDPLLDDDWGENQEPRHGYADTDRSRAPLSVRPPAQEKSRAAWVTKLLEEDTENRSAEETIDARAKPARSTPGHRRGDTPPILPISTLNAQYQIGIPDYEVSQNIADDTRKVDGLYIGEYGIGVNTKAGLLQNNADQVIAFDVWLFDKTDEQKLSNHTRILLSEYAIDHRMEDTFVKDKRDGPGPIVPQKGTSFQLRGHHLLLDCQIVDVEYANSGPDKGIFRRLHVEMNVYRI